MTKYYMGGPNAKPENDGLTPQTPIPQHCFNEKVKLYRGDKVRSFDGTINIPLVVHHDRDSSDCSTYSVSDKTVDEVHF